LLLYSATILLINAQKSRAHQSNQISLHHHNPIYPYIRGGSQEQQIRTPEEEENEELDALIEDLIQEVDDEDNSVVVNEVEESSKTDERDDIEDDSVSIEVAKTPLKKKKKKKKQRVGNVDEHKTRQSASDDVQVGQRSSSNNSTEGDGSDNISSTSKKKQSNKSLRNEKIEEKPPAPPNALYRMLLAKGKAGHILVISLVILTEYCTVYLPELIALLSSVAQSIGIYNPNDSDRAFSGRSSSYASGDYKGGTNPTYAAFQRTKSATRGKAAKALRKREDKAAMQDLKLIGDPMDAKYRYLSDGFMKRHCIGKYRTVDVSSGAAGYDQKRQQVGITDASDVESEEDDSGIVDTLKGYKGSESTGKGHENSGGVNFSIGFDVKSSSSHKLKKKRGDSSIMASANPTDILGRLRESATGLQSTYSSTRILGAYPGDAVPIDEAGSADGLVSLARRYGYGDWESDDEGDFEGPSKANFTSSSRRKRKITMRISGRQSSLRQDRGRKRNHVTSESSPTSARSSTRNKNISRSRMGTRRTMMPLENLKRAKARQENE